MTPFPRRFAARAGLTLVALCLWRAGPAGPSGTAAPPALPAAAVQVTIYDPDPHHLWNRLHRALWVRTGPDGKEYGHDRLDPLLWAETRHLVEGKSHEQVVAVLDEFLAKQGEKLVPDPLKKAILQRDLWAVFDWAAEPGANTREAHLQPPTAARRALQQRLARCIRRLALTAEQIKGLPDNYAAAVAARAFAQQPDPEHPGHPFLPPDLFQNDGPWVELEADNGTKVAATRHVFDFGARSAFRVFLRLPEGRKETVAYLAHLREFPRPWEFTREPGSMRDTLVLNPELPQFPAGTQAALVRQMLLVDRTGRIAATRVTESVQVRVFRSIPKRTPETNRRPGAASGQEFYEFRRSRSVLFAGKAGGLQPLGRDDRDFATQLLALPVDEFELPSGDDSFERRMGRPMLGCRGCHDGPGIHSFRTYTGGDFPRGRFSLLDLEANHDAGQQGELSAMRKRDQFNWGLLQGLWDNQPRQ